MFADSDVLSVFGGRDVEVFLEVVTKVAAAVVAYFRRDLLDTQEGRSQELPGLLHSESYQICSWRHPRFFFEKVGQV